MTSAREKRLLHVSQWLGSVAGRIDRIGDAVGDSFWRWSVAGVAVVMVFALVRDVRVKMWTDELFTLLTAQQGGPAAIIDATADGLDAAAPLYTMTVSAILPIVGHEALAIRLPATVGYAAMLLSLLALCRRRLPGVYALVPPLLVHAGSQFYASEGRGYAVALGCGAGALLCWQSAAQDRRRPVTVVLLAGCLMLMTAMHYYSIFILVPLCLAEAVRWWKRRILDVAVIAAITSPLLVIALHFPLMKAAQPFQQHPWSPAGWRQIPGFYGEFFLPMLSLCGGVLVVALAALASRRVNRNVPVPAWPVHEHAAFIAIALLPPVIIGVSKYTTHLFTGRYALWIVVGFAVLSGRWACRAARGQPGAGIVLVCVLLLVVAAQEIRTTLLDPMFLRNGESIRRALATLPDGDEPIVVADSHVFLQVAHYSEPRVRRRLIYPVSVDLARRYTWSDTAPRLLAAVGRRTPLRTMDYETLLTTHRRFVLAALPTDYLQWHLAQSGHRVTLLGAATRPVLYSVEVVTSR